MTTTTRLPGPTDRHLDLQRLFYPKKEPSDHLLPIPLERIIRELTRRGASHAELRILKHETFHPWTFTVTFKGEHYTGWGPKARPLVEGMTLKLLGHPDYQGVSFQAARPTESVPTPPVRSYSPAASIPKKPVARVRL